MDANHPVCHAAKGSGHGSFSFRRCSPPREIRSVIESIWTFAADSGGPGLTDCVLPDVGAEIICRIDEPCVFVRGPQFQVEEIAIPSSARYVGARLRPGAASPLLGIPAADVCRSRIPMEAIGVAMAKELWDIG